MRLRTLVVCTLVAAAAGLAAGEALSQEQPAGPPPFRQPTPEEMQSGMQRWMQTMKPGEHHKGLARFLGTWNVTVRMWMGEQPMESKGTSTFSWLFKDRWIKQEMDAPMMGMPMQTFGIVGYDNYRHAYQALQLDSLTTVMNKVEGNYDQSRKNLIFYGTIDEPMTGELGKPVKFVYRFQDADHFTAEVHDLAIGETGTRVVEYVYERAK